jgi:hypothetical protein
MSATRGLCSGNVRSTPSPETRRRTVALRRVPPPCSEITVPAEQLHAFLVAFLDQVVDVDGVTDSEVRNRRLHVLEFELAQDVHGWF